MSVLWYEWNHTRKVHLLNDSQSWGFNRTISSFYFISTSRGISVMNVNSRTTTSRFYFQSNDYKVPASSRPRFILQFVIFLFEDQRLEVASYSILYQRRWFTFDALHILCYQLARQFVSYLPISARTCVLILKKENVEAKLVKFLTLSYNLGDERGESYRCRTRMSLFGVFVGLVCDNWSRSTVSSSVVSVYPEYGFISIGLYTLWNYCTHALSLDNLYDNITGIIKMLSCHVTAVQYDWKRSKRSSQLGDNTNGNFQLDVISNRWVHMRDAINDFDT